MINSKKKSNKFHDLFLVFLIKQHEVNKRKQLKMKVELGYTINDKALGLLRLDQDSYLLNDM